MSSLECSFIPHSLAREGGGTVGFIIAKHLRGDHFCDVRGEVSCDREARLMLYFYKRVRTCILYRQRLASTARDNTIMDLYPTRRDRAHIVRAPCDRRDARMIAKSRRARRRGETLRRQLSRRSERRAHFMLLYQCCRKGNKVMIL